MRLYGCETDNMKSSCCASCGIAEIDDIKLMPCNSCDLVRYCSVNCQRDHISCHLQACRKRAAELRDELLFKQPEGSCYGDCPICSLPLPLDGSKSGMYMCCSKVICLGCDHANRMREDEMRLQRTCPFCREALPETKECDKLRMKRIEVNDPVAIFQEGALQYQKGDYQRAFEYYAKAAALGDANAHYRLSILYNNGQGVKTNNRKMIYHMVEAAVGGHPVARHNLGNIERFLNNNFENAKRHWIISATQGYDESTKELLQAFKEGYVEKEELAAALRAHQAAVDATKSSQRKVAEEFQRIPFEQ